MTETTRPVGSRYVAERRIGHGSMGEVWCGRDLTSGSAVAIKFLRGDLVAQEDFVARFLREARILKSLDDPRLVGIADFVAEGSSLAIVMDLVEGRDLGALLRAHGPLPEDRAVHLLDEVLQGLAVVHRGGIVHSDIKPANLMVPDDQRPPVRIADFGIARIVEEAGTGNSASDVIGSPLYMAPELAQGSPATAQSDVYALGIVAFELLTGAPPFRGGNAMSVLYRHLHEEIARPVGVSDALWRWLSAVLAKDPAARPPDALTALGVLRSATADTSSTVTLSGDQLPPPVSWEAEVAAGGGTMVLPADAMAQQPQQPRQPQPAGAGQGPVRRRGRWAGVVIVLLAVAVVAEGILLVRALTAQPPPPPLAVEAGSPSPSATVSTSAAPGVRRTAGPLPNVVGMDMASARDTLASYGYVVQVKESVDDSRPDGEVTSQDPGSGGTPADGTVRLSVSRRSSIKWLSEFKPAEGKATSGRIDLKDRSFANGIALESGCSAPSGVTYQLGRRYTKLQAVLALADAPQSTVAVNYRVLLDGRQINAGQLSGANSQNLSVDLSGGGALRIEASASPGATCGSARLVLGDPRLTGLPA